MPVNNNQNNLQSVTQQIYKKNLELLGKRRRAEQLLYGISEAVYAVSKDFKITLFNNTIEQMLNVKSTEALNKDADEVIFLKDKNNNRISIKDYCFAKDSDETKLQGAILEGSDNKQYYVNVKSSIISEDTEGEECLVTMSDITKEKELERAKDDFISITSHELRTPMSIIKSYLWMLASGKGGPLTNKQNRYIDKAVQGTERMLNLINDMLNISKIEQGRVEIEIQQVDLKSLLEEIENDFTVKADEKSLYIKTEIHDDIKTVYADKNKLREVIVNLVGNSFKFTERGGITVKVEKFIGKEDFAKVSVIDTGRGLSDDEIKRLFHKFGRLDNSYQTVAEAGGTGLGLYIVKLIIEAVGGETHVESEGKGKGSTFWFTLPTKYTPPLVESNNTVENKNEDKDEHEKSIYANANSSTNTN